MGATIVDGPGIGFPPKLKKRAWGLAALFVASGCAVSLMQHNWGWLAHIGAIVVVLAAVVASFNTYIEAKYVIDLLDKTFDPSEGIYEAMKAKPHLYGISRSLAESEAMELMAKEREIRKREFHAALQREFEGDLKRTELRIGAVGTFLWGFADLLNIPCGW